MELGARMHKNKESDMARTEDDFLSAMNQPVIDGISYYVRGALMFHVKKGRTRIEALQDVTRELQDLDNLPQDLEEAVDMATDGGNFTSEEAAWFVGRTAQYWHKQQIKEYPLRD